MLRPWVFIGFTGNRTLSNPDSIRGKIEEGIRRIAEYSHGPVAAVSSAAKGADTLFVECALEQSLPWVLLLPFPETEFFNTRDFSVEDLARIQPLVERAAIRHIEPPTESNLSTGERRTNAFADCSARTVDDSDYLIAVWDGQAGNPGGTGSTVAYAREHGKPLIWIDALTGEIREENFPKRLPANVVAAMPTQDAVTGGLPAVVGTMKHYDDLAMSRGPEAQTIVRDVIFWHLGATFAGLLEPVFGLFMLWAACGKTFKLAVLLYAKKRAHAQHDIKHEWLHSRIVAELCRAAVATWPLAYSPKTHQPVMVPGFRDWQRSLVLWRLIAPPTESSVEGQRDRYLSYRLENADTGQIPYFEKQLDRACRKQRRWQRIASWSTNGAIFCAALGLAVLIGYHFFPENHLIHALKAGKSWITFFGLSLPLLSSAAFTFLMASDCNRRVDRNREMLIHLRRCRDRIRTVKTRSGLERHVAETESMLLLEVLEWHSVTQFTANAH